MTTMKMTSAQLWRWLRLIGAAFALLALVLLLTGCGGKKDKECKHEWSPATCTTPATCSKCGATQGSPNGHTYAGQSCTGVDKCIICEAIIPATGHVWTEATCTEPKTCSKCGETEGQPLGHDIVNGVCTRCGDFGEFEWTTISNSGSGNQSVADIVLSYDYYALHVTHSGSKQFELKMTDATGAEAILVHTTGAYDGTVLIYGASPISFDITADGEWAYQINKVEAGEGTFTASGTGDGVSKRMPAQSGAYHITHNGKGNFYVYAFTNAGAVEVVKAWAVKGAFDKNIDLQFPTDSEVIFEVHADGEWAINAN